LLFGLADAIFHVRLNWLFRQNIISKVRTFGNETALINDVIAAINVQGFACDQAGRVVC
jgi:hypothetical protein